MTGRAQASSVPGEHGDGPVPQCQPCIALAHGADDRRQQAALARMTLEDSGERRRVVQPGGVDTLERSPIAVPALIFQDRAPRGGIGRLLQAAVDGRIDLVPRRECVGTVLPDHLGPRHLRDVGGLEFDDRAMDTPRDRLGIGGVVRGRIDPAEFEHAAQDVRTPLDRPFDARHRVVERGRTRQAGDQRGLRQGQVGDRLVEIHLGRGADAVGALPEENPVQVQRQDFLLGKLALQAQREEDFLELAAQGAFRREHGVARKLHRDRAAAFPHAARADVRDQGPHQPLPVDAGMLVEARVFRGQERLDDRCRDLLERHRDAALLADLCDEPAIARIDPQRQLGLHVPQRGGIRNLRREVLIRPGEPHAHQQHQGKSEGQQATEDSRHDIATCCQNCDPFLDALRRPVHSSRRFKGKPAERRGRKVTGLQEFP